MNREKILKARIFTMTALFLLTAVALAVFIGLYIDETDKTKQSYTTQYMENMRAAGDELAVYIEKQTDYDVHYNMVLSDLGAARTLIFLTDEPESHRKAVNEFHYCFVKYPEQMRDKLAECEKAINDVTANLDKGYTEIDEIVNSIDKKGT